jgi:phospholipase/carboxylesterase
LSILTGPSVPPKSGGAPHQLAVLLHGYGSDGADLIGLAPYWQDGLPEARFIAPNAPQPCPGSPGYQWFPIYFGGREVSWSGATEARETLVRYLRELWDETGIAPENTLLAGFSQGAMVALHAGLSIPERLMGIVAIAGAFAPPPGFGEGKLGTPPVCLVHGDRDGVVEPRFSAEAARILEAAGIAVDYHVSPGVAHGIAPDGVAFVDQFIRKINQNNGNTVLHEQPSQD